MKQLTPDQSRELAGICRTPLAQAYVEVQAPYWGEFREQWPVDELQWLADLCIRSGDIAVRYLTDDPDRIIPKLLATAAPEDAAKVVQHLKDGPDNFVLDMDKIASSAQRDKADFLPPAHSL